MTQDPALAKRWITQHASILAIVLFKLCWFCVVVLQEQGLFPAAVLIILMVLIHPGRRLAFCVSAIILTSGLLMDSLLTVGGIFRFPAVDTGLWNLPAWLVLLWCAFSLVMTSGFLFLGKYSKWVQSLAGVCAGGVGYGAGYLLNAVELPGSVFSSLVLIALLWAVCVPLWFQLIRRFKVTGL